MIRLSGRSEDEVEIAFTGLRPGEKLYEDLFYEDEQRLTTSSSKVHRTHADLMSWAKLIQHLRELQILCHDGSGVSIREKVRDIIPEYTYVRGKAVYIDSKEPVETKIPVRHHLVATVSAND